MCRCRAANLGIACRMRSHLRSSRLRRRSLRPRHKAGALQLLNTPPPPRNSYKSYYYRTDLAFSPSCARSFALIEAISSRLACVLFACMPALSDPLDCAAAVKLTPAVKRSPALTLLPEVKGELEFTSVLVLTNLADAAVSLLRPAHAVVNALRTHTARLSLTTLQGIFARKTLPSAHPRSAHHGDWLYLRLATRCLKDILTATAVAAVTAATGDRKALSFTLLCGLLLRRMAILICPFQVKTVLLGAVVYIMKFIRIPLRVPLVVRGSFSEGSSLFLGVFSCRRINGK